MQDPIADIKRADPCDDATVVLERCQAAADAEAAAHVSTIRADTNLTEALKASFFAGFRAALEDPMNAGQRPLDVMRRFVDENAGQYMRQGPVAGPDIDVADTRAYVNELLEVAARENVTRVLITGNGAALYREAELVLVGPPAVDCQSVFAYCCTAAALRSPSGVPIRVEVVTRPRDGAQGVQLLLASDTRGVSRK